MESYLCLKIFSTSVNSIVAATFPFSVTIKGFATINCSNHKIKLTIPKLTENTIIIPKITEIIVTATLFLLIFFDHNIPPGMM